jgi:hypothetical protein
VVKPNLEQGLFPNKLFYNESKNQPLSASFCLVSYQHEHEFHSEQHLDGELMTTKWRNVSSPCCFTTSHFTSGENSQISINSPVQLLWKGKPDVVAPNYQGLTAVPSSSYNSHRNSVL